MCVFYQTLLCINPPLFEVSQVLLSPTQSHVALLGQRGITVLELPQRWGKRSEFEGGRIQINCKYVSSDKSYIWQTLLIKVTYKEDI